jgi:hypothetical protein
MPPRKKKAEPTGDHDVQVERYKSTMMNRDLFEPLCSCGYPTLRYFTEAEAEAWGREHRASFS